MKYAVVIAERNEPDLPNTLDSIKATAPDAVPVVMTDDKGLGPQRMRHLGVEQADFADVVIVVDGHMRFAPGTLQDMAAYLRRHPKNVACAKCYHNPRIDFEGKPYTGARMTWATEEITKDKHGKVIGRDFWALAAKWRKDDSVGKIGAVMGACYGFTRDWYLEQLRAPWQWGTGWGCDEEVISLANWLCGGENVLLDLGVAHLERTTKTRHFHYSDRQFAGVWANRWRVVNMLPLAERERTELRDWLAKNGLGDNAYRQINGHLNRSVEQVAAYREYLAGQKRSFADWRLTWCDQEKENKVGVPELRKQLAAAGIADTAMMRRNQLTRLKIDLDKYGRKPKEEPKPKTVNLSRSNWGANEKPRQCRNQACGSRNSKINDKTYYQNPPRCIRHRQCLDCGQRYTTSEQL